MLKVLILCYKKFVRDTSEIQCKLNPYHPYAVKKIINTKQHALLWHVDNVKISHMKLKVNEKFTKWVELTHRSNKLGYVKVYRGKKHYYLGITLDYSTRGVFKVDVTDCIDAMKEDFPCKTNKTLKAWNNKSFSVDVNSPSLEKEKSGVLDTLTIKCMFLCKRERPSIKSRVGFLSTQTKISKQ